ncbi:MAG: T9SS type A sorting domain-containing protein, partial [Bacteroidetes bacterium]|nr:T9SS type A sorting domain-containing protein [Bacteroidota bacterium]
YLDRQFYDAIFGENLTLIGDANGDSKEDNASFIAGSPYIRWCAYQLNVFGDPTMDIWTAVPTAISVTYPTSVIIGSSQISFETDAPYARICVMQNDSVLGRDLADSNGDLTLNLFDPINSADTLNVSIIAHDRIRHLGDIIVITNQPFIVYEACLIDDSLGGNNNGQIDYGETIDLTVWMINIGNLDASNVDVILSSEDPFVTITDSIENYGAILAGQSICITDGFQFEVSSDIPDQHSILFELEAIETETWISYFTIDANAPELTIGNLIVVDSVTGNGNGMMDPGETVEIYIESSNTGHSLVTDVDGTISSYNSLLTIITSNYSIDTLVPGETQYAIYQISINPIAHIGMNFDLDNEIISGAYSDEKTFYIKVGMICEDWETGDFTQFNWFYGGDADWSLTTTNTFEGIYSALSGTIGDNQSSELIITLQVLGDDSISFYRKVSSEPNFDHLNFYIDDEKIDEWSGDVSYERVAFPVTYGIHTFKWAYEKDEAISGGLDCAWLDYIQLPYTIVPAANAGPDTTICAGDTCILDGSATNFTEIMWTTSGTGSFNDSSLMDPVYYPSEDDIINGGVVLTLHAMHNLGANICDDMILTINDVPATPETPEGPTYIDLFTIMSSEYTIPVITNTDSYLWVLYPEDAGTIEGTDTTGTVAWNGSFLGHAYLKVKGMNDCGTGEFSDSLEVFVDNTVGLDKKSSGTVTFEIIPNPATDQTNILFYLNEDAIITLKIYSSQGELINNIVSNVMLQKGKHKFMINLSSLRKGVYYCVLITNNNLLSKKMVIFR